MNGSCAYSTPDYPAFPIMESVVGAFPDLADSAPPADDQREKTREALICEHIPYVKALVNRLAWRLPPHVELDDLIHAGIVGLIKAVDSFDPSRDIKLLTYAQHRIHGAVLSELRSRDFLTRTDRKKLREMERAYETLERSGLETVSDEAIAKEMGVELSEVHELQSLARISFVSAEELGFSLENGEGEEEIDWCENHEGDGFAHLRLQEVHQTLAQALDRLSEKERLVLSLYYNEELTMKEIGAVLSLTESRVSQIHSQALARLRRMLRQEDVLGD